VSCFAQIKPPLTAKLCGMRTADECRAIAHAKLEEAKRNRRRRRSLSSAAEAWLLLAKRLSEHEFKFDRSPPEV